MTGATDVVNTADFSTACADFAAPRLQLRRQRRSVHPDPRRRSASSAGRPPYVWVTNAYANSGLTQALLSCNGARDSDLHHRPRVAADHLRRRRRGQPADAVDRLLRSWLQVPADDAGGPRPRPSAAVEHGRRTLDLLYTRTLNQFYLNDVNLLGVQSTEAGEGGRLQYGIARHAERLRHRLDRSRPSGSPPSPTTSSASRTPAATTRSRPRSSSTSAFSNSALVQRRVHPLQDQGPRVPDLEHLELEPPVRGAAGAAGRPAARDVLLRRAEQARPHRHLQHPARVPGLADLRRRLGDAVHLHRQQRRQRRRLSRQRPDLRADQRVGHHAQDGPVGLDHAGQLHHQRTLPRQGAGDAAGAQHLPRAVAELHQRPSDQGHSRPCAGSRWRCRSTSSTCRT